MSKAEFVTEFTGTFPWEPAPNLTKIPATHLRRGRPVLIQQVIFGQAGAAREDVTALTRYSPVKLGGRCEPFEAEVVRPSIDLAVGDFVVVSAAGQLALPAGEVIIEARLDQLGGKNYYFASFLNIYELLEV